MRLLGVPPERLLGARFESFLAPADRPALGRLQQHHGPGNGNGAHAEVRLQRAGGDAVPVLLSVAALADGQSMWLVTDLSEAKRHQAADERTRKFLAILAHEFRNMLNTMHLSVEVLSRHELDPECRKALDSVRRQMQRMLQVVDDLRSVNPPD